MMLRMTKRIGYKDFGEAMKANLFMDGVHSVPPYGVD
jgi:hypothetical protein